MPQYSIFIPGKGTFQVDSPTELTDAQAYAAVLQNMPAEEKAAPFSLKDTLLNVGTSALGATKAATDVFGAANPASQALERGQQSLTEMMSPETRREMAADAAREAEAAKQGPLAEVGAALETAKKSPARTLAQSVGSIIPTLTSLLIPGVGEARAAMAARTAYMTALSIAQGAGAVKGSIYDNVRDSLIRNNVPPEEAAKMAMEAQNYFGENFPQIALGGGLGYVAGRSGIEKMLGGGTRGLTRPLAAEILTEAGQGGQEKYAAGSAAQKLGLTNDPWAGVAGAATKEGIMGGIGAGVVHPFVGSPEAIQAAQAAQQRGVPLGEAREIGTAPEEVAAKTATEVTPTTEVAPVAEAAAAAAPVQKDKATLATERDALKTQVDTLEQQLQDAGLKGDTKTINELFPQHKEAKDKLDAVQALLGEEAEPSVVTKTAALVSAAKLDQQIKTTQKKLEDAATLGEFSSMGALAKKLDKLREERAAIDEQATAELEAAPKPVVEKTAAPVIEPEKAKPVAEEVIKEEPAPAPAKKTRAKKAAPEAVVEEAPAEEAVTEAPETVAAETPAPAPASAKKTRAKKEKTPDRKSVV